MVGIHNVAWSGIGRAMVRGFGGYEDQRSAASRREPEVVAGDHGGGGHTSIDAHVRVTDLCLVVRGSSLFPGRMFCAV